MDLPDARDAVHPCRPTISCTADIVAPGTLETEVGAISSRLADGTRVLAVPFLLKQSLATFLQLQVGSNGYTTTTNTPAARYFDNLTIGPKFHLADETALRPSLAVTIQWSVPTFAARGYTRSNNGLAIAHASKDIGPIHLDGNIGGTVFELGRVQGFGALALSAALPGTPFGAAIEGYWFSRATPAAAEDAGLRGFVSVSPRSWWTFDVGGDVGLVAATRAYSLFAGVTFLPAIFFRP